MREFLALFTYEINISSVQGHCTVHSIRYSTQYTVQWIVIHCQNIVSASIRDPTADGWPVSYGGHCTLYSIVYTLPYSTVHWIVIRLDKTLFAIWPTTLYAYNTTNFLFFIKTTFNEILLRSRTRFNLANKIITHNPDINNWQGGLPKSFFYRQPPPRPPSHTVLVHSPAFKRHKSYY